MTAAALALEGIDHAYGAKTVLADVSMDLREGEILCLLGPSGCGKTTILRLAAGLETPRRGRIRIGERVVTGDGVLVPPEKRDIGLMFQDYALFPHLTVAGNIAFGLRHLPATEQAGRVAEMIERTRLGGLATAYPHTLSGGEQQRAALARALAPGPKVLLLDEPFSGLDTLLRQGVRDDTLHVLKEVGTAVVLVTHDPEEALFMADRIALMNAGRILQTGEPADLYFRPISAFAAAFFGEVNRLAARVAGGRVALPFASLSAGGIAEGSAVTCLIRSEAMRLSTRPPEGHGAPHAVVEAARLLGRTSLVHMHSHPSAGPPVHLHARAMGLSLPAPGTPVWIEIDPRLAFVFPEDGNEGKNQEHVPKR
jgi:iron(III) transport system ATP-binding protein